MQKQIQPDSHTSDEIVQDWTNLSTHTIATAGLIKN